MSQEYDSDYSVIPTDLATVAGKKQFELVQAGRPVGAVTILELPVAAVGHVYLRFGVNGDPIPLRQEALTFFRQPARNNGVFLDCDPAIAGILKVMVGLDIGLSA